MTPLEKFGIACLQEHRGELGDLDGGWLQDTAEKLGILVRVKVTEPCGESCNCAEESDFPQDCLRYNDEVKALIESNNFDIAMKLHPDRIEHHEAAAEFIREGKNAR